VLVEVHPGSHFDPIRAVPEVDGVQVRGQDPVLRPLALELPGERGLLQLAADRSLSMCVRVLDELLRNRGAALDHGLVADVCPDGAEDAAVVDALVLPEAAVLDRDDRLFHERRDVTARDHDPALVAAQRREHCLAVGGVDVTELLRPLGRRRLERSHVACDRAYEPVGKGHERHESEDANERQSSELADPAPLRRPAASAEQHAAHDSSPSATPRTP
jgi:hypothetical protein